MKGRKFLITGIGGSGKTTIIREVEKRGFVGVDLDDTELCFWVNKNNGKREVYTKGAGKEWLINHSWVADVEGLTEYLSNLTSNKDFYIAGKISSNQLNEVFPLFDKVFLLSPSDEVLKLRQSTRTNKKNDFAKSKEEQTQILSKRKAFESKCIDLRAHLINADEPIEVVVGDIIDSTREV